MVRRYHDETLHPRGKGAKFSRGPYREGVPDLYSTYEHSLPNVSGRVEVKDATIGLIELGDFGLPLNLLLFASCTTGPEEYPRHLSFHTYGARSYCLVAREVFSGSLGVNNPLLAPSLLFVDTKTSFVSGIMQQTETLTATMALPKDPASPTLTNPDMILPYGEYDSTPSPPRRSFRTASDSEEWRGPIPASLPFSIGPPHTPLSSRTSVTPIIYGNGTMLSDIGEVTEAESNPGRKLPGPAQRRLLKQAQGLPLRSGPTAGHGGAKQARYGTHGRKVSVESVSTVTDEPQSAEVFKDFDDGVSVDDSNFQGDDEGSVADSYSEEVVAMEIQRLSRLESSLARDDDPNSSAALSRRAEQILLNAKKRLNVRLNMFQLISYLNVLTL